MTTAHYYYNQSREILKITGAQLLTSMCDPQRLLPCEFICRERVQNNFKTLLS